MEVSVNDTVKITLDCNLDVSAYTNLDIKYRKPDGTTGVWDATIDPTDNAKIYYQCDNDDLDIDGEWKVQAYVSVGASQLHGKWDTFEVHEPLV
jgi:hypothetical protein